MINLYKHDQILRLPTPPNRVIKQVVGSGLIGPCFILPYLIVHSKLFSFMFFFEKMWKLRKYHIAVILKMNKKNSMKTTLDQKVVPLYLASEAVFLLVQGRT